VNTDQNQVNLGIKLFMDFDSGLTTGAGTLPDNKALVPVVRPIGPRIRLLLSLYGPWTRSFLGGVLLLHSGVDRIFHHHLVGPLYIYTRACTTRYTHCVFAFAHGPLEAWDT
jgi:hypothetical protein